ncbi:M48 family metallopeptidase [Persicobacter diffluens]|uniref:Peptidase M48 n=1 Tax=Persicobacter diffluens TaxID=981 RepID=A0AAN4VZ18_9BACT|nr:peptidase M48 [Persicobacter diffluens]
MDAITIKWIVVGVLGFNFLIDKWLSMLNDRHERGVVPPELDGLYSPEERSKSLNYHDELKKLGNWSGLVSLALTLVVIFSGALGSLEHWIAQYTDSTIFITLGFFAAITIISDVISLPFDWYGTFTIEEKYGFNKMTRKTFWLDKAKGYALGGLLSGGLLAGLVAFLENYGTSYWYVFWLILVGFLFLMNILYPTVIMPLFNKFTPLEAGVLRSCIERYSASVDFPLQNIFVMDGSKRSTKANAFFAGLGKFKRLVLFDTLIEELEEEEIVGVFAHEVGHFKKGHIYQGFIIGAMQMGLMVFLFSWMVTNPLFTEAMGGSGYSIGINLLVFGLLFSPLNLILGFFANLLSRKNEYEADAYAASTASGSALIEALKKISTKSLSGLNPHPYFVALHYSHPPLLYRIRAIQEETVKQ